LNILKNERGNAGDAKRGEAMKCLHQAWVFAVLTFFHINLLKCQDTGKSDQWTWLYYRTFSPQDYDSFKEKNDIFFAKDDVPLFSQLVFSWNSLRPSKGYYSFWVQARDADNKKWGSWHKMMEWGSHVQRSFKNKVDQFTSYEHVRLEISPDKLADGFRVRISSHDGASLQLMKAFAVSLSNFSNFKSEVDSGGWSSLSSVYIRNVPTISQFALDHHRADAICSPTSCTILTSFLLQNYVDAHDFAEKSFDKGLNVYGSWPFNMAHAFETCAGSFLFFTARLNSFSRLHQRLQDGIPVVVSVRGPLRTAASAYKHGHLLVVVGYDAKTKEVICHDPAFKNDRATVHRYAVKDFLEAWERSRRLAYVTELK
jgi:hypothetical protein